MHNKQLEPLDILRGFVLFGLVGLEAVMHALDEAIDTPKAKRAFSLSPSTGALVGQMYVPLPFTIV